MLLSSLFLPPQITLSSSLHKLHYLPLTINFTLFVPPETIFSSSPHSHYMQNLLIPFPSRHYQPMTSASRTEMRRGSWTLWLSRRTHRLLRLNSFIFIYFHYLHLSSFILIYLHFCRLHTTPMKFCRPLASFTPCVFIYHICIYY